MRGREPMFGEWGALILQLVISVVIVLGLVAVVYWLVRRYSPGSLGRLSRSRVPRLAVIDAMTVDARRRLVLVRRDNVEHLILIGGPTDVVIEQAIQRRRPAICPQVPGEAAEAQPAEPEPRSSQVENPPIPFPQARIQHSPSPEPATTAERSYAPARRASASSGRSESAGPPIAASALSFEAMAEAVSPFPDAQANESPSVSAPQGYSPYATSSPYARNGHHANGEQNGSASAPAETSPYAMPHLVEPDTAAKVNDLEREMARLLGEITSKRPS